MGDGIGWEPDVELWRYGGLVYVERPQLCPFAGVTVHGDHDAALTGWARIVNGQSATENREPWRGQVLRLPAGDWRFDGSTWRQIVQG